MHYTALIQSAMHLYLLIHSSPSIILDIFQNRKYSSIGCPSELFCVVVFYNLFAILNQPENRHIHPHFIQWAGLICDVQHNNWWWRRFRWRPAKSPKQFWWPRWSRWLYDLLGRRFYSWKWKRQRINRLRKIWSQNFLVTHDGPYFLSMVRKYYFLIFMVVWYNKNYNENIFILCCDI